MTKTQMMTISKRAVLGQVNRRQEKDGWRRVKAYRGRWQLSEGNWFEIDIRRNAVIAQHLDLEARARDLGVMADYEEMES